ncbi:MAG TPA: preprotein translocase subunit YajC [Candidatus Binatia bacterium]|nr:preprotein translocase subunit YajC [Candidatus Binatia bacterium]
MLFPDFAYAAASAPGGGAQSMLPTIIMIGSMLAIFYFLLLRPQQRQKQDRERMLASIKKGDRVVTTGGLHGTVTGLNEHTVVLRVADQVKVEFDRSAIGRVVAGQGEKDA